MNAVILLVGCLVVSSAGCFGPQKDPANTVIAKESFSIGAFQPSETEYNCRHYDSDKAAVFLASLTGRFAEGDVVAVDGLKWMKNEGEWSPIPNPPIPVMDQNKDPEGHTLRYAEWINNHPHFGYPPLPMQNKE